MPAFTGSRRTPLHSLEQGLLPISVLQTTVLLPGENWAVPLPNDPELLRIVTSPRGHLNVWDDFGQDFDNVAAHILADGLGDGLLMRAVATDPEALIVDSTRAVEAKAPQGVAAIPSDLHSHVARAWVAEVPLLAQKLLDSHLVRDVVGHTHDGQKPIEQLFEIFHLIAPRCYSLSESGLSRPKEIIL